MIHSISTPALIFLSTFITVFALGFQSLNVNNGHRMAAVMTSLLISGGNIVILKIIPNGDIVSINTLAYVLGGPVGIYCSMIAHAKFMKNKRTLNHNP